MSNNEDELVLSKQVQRQAHLSGDRIRVLVSQGLFPKPVRLGRYRLAWRRSEIQAWIAALPRADEMPVKRRGVVKTQAKARAPESVTDPQGRQSPQEIRADPGLNPRHQNDGRRTGGRKESKS